MSSQQRKTAKRKAKRRVRKHELKVTESRARQWRAGDDHPIHECLVNADWQDSGTAAIFFSRRLSPLCLNYTGFLIDVWAMGLKDATGHLDLDLEAYDDLIADAHAELDLIPLDITLARHLVYGGVALAKELGFRLPRRYERWTALLGPLPPGVEPDMSLFLDEGRIHLNCGVRDFHERLMGTTPERFLARADVINDLVDHDFSLLDDDAPDMEMVDMVGECMLTAIQQSCFVHGEQPSPRLNELIEMFLLTSIDCMPITAESDEDFLDFDTASHINPKEMIRSLLDNGDPSDNRELDQAMAQLGRFMEESGSPEEFVELLAPLDGEEE